MVTDQLVDVPGFGLPTHGIVSLHTDQLTNGVASYYMLPEIN